MSQVALLTVLLFAAAVLYTAVGHGGASGYLAVMALVGIAPDTMKPTALVLNILVAAIAAARYARAGAFAWRALWPFLVGSVPLAVLGGAIHLPGHIYQPVVGVILLAAAIRLLWPTKATAGNGERDAGHTPGGARRMPVVPAVASGGTIGLLSGLTGTGGGIFLSPLLLFTGWLDPRKTAGVSAAFILVNSVAGLAGNLASVRSLPGALPVWALAAMAGGFVGAGLGSRRLGHLALQRVLGVVLVVAGLKLLLT